MEETYSQMGDGMERERLRSPSEWGDPKGNRGGKKVIYYLVIDFKCFISKNPSNNLRRLLIYPILQMRKLRSRG